MPPIGRLLVVQHSVFCLCPTGDSKGFTARLYFSLVHGCIPVRVDGHRRSMEGPNRWRYPFPRLLDWERLVVDMPWAETPSLLQRLKSFTSAEVSRRQDYLHSVAHWLVYDTPGVAEDAATATILELERRLL